MAKKPRKAGYYVTKTTLAILNNPIGKLMAAQGNAHRAAQGHSELATLTWVKAPIADDNDGR